MVLREEGFEEFFRDIHGCDPFPWQSRLLRQVLSDSWPETLALPTGTGKTAVMDVAVYALACGAPRVGPRRAPRRIVLVVDRRIVVDDAFRRAMKIRDALRNPTTDFLREAARALLSLGGETPLDAALLRGGIYREDRWARTPAQPVILCSTVDQVGSRLLFRGYGISGGMWPIHAGLLGNDALIVLDEAHCSRPFLRTLRQIGRYRSRAERPLELPFSVVAMTATPSGDRPPFMLDEDDRQNEALHRRIAASKRMTFVELGTRNRGDGGSAAACMGFLRGTPDSPGLAVPGGTVLAVLNRVGSARRLREELRKVEGEWPHEAILLTGRCRPVERDALLESVKERILAGRKRGEAEGRPPLVVVATQCVEVGADIDADALITEACPLDAFQQRLGRLDRLGELGESGGVCFLRPEQGGASPKPDPIYGEALAATWKWLTSRADGKVLDCGTEAMKALLSEAPGGLCAPAPDAPTIFPAYCDLWCQTGPEPAVSPDPAVFLHGPQEGAPDVRLVWRADLGPDPDTWVETLSLCPPVSGESLPLPIHQARAWLTGGTVPDGGDTEGEPEEPDGRGVPEGRNLAPRFAGILRWLGPERSVPILAGEDPRLRPGDVLVLPAEAGGCDEEGWNPDAARTRDVADEARRKARKHAVLRLHPSFMEDTGAVRPLLEPFADLSTEEGLPEDIEAKVDALLVELAERREELPESLWDCAAALHRDGRRRVEPHPSGKGLVIYARVRLGRGDLGDFTDEDAQSAQAGAGKVSLEDHLSDAAARAGECSCALPEHLRADVILSARVHDLGKADPRFQTWLAGGNRLRALRSGLLAKSASLRAGPREVEAARVRSGYPKGGRHELLSLRLVESCPGLTAQAGDPDLLLHLLASHHGHARPFAPDVADSSPRKVFLTVGDDSFSASSDTGLGALNAGVPDRFCGDWPTWRHA
jgi:CRISPR-associated endonuclease/helicase Cas3